MPLSMVKAGETNIIRKIGGKEEVRKFLENLGFVTGGEPNTILRVGGNEETKRFLENLGFVTGAKVTVVSTVEGNIIVNVKDSRIAIGKDMANKIMVN